MELGRLRAYGESPQTALPQRFSTYANLKKDIEQLRLKDFDTPTRNIFFNATSFKNGIAISLQ